MIWKGVSTCARESSADIAADAFANVLDAAFRDLGGQEGIRDRGASGADDVQHTRAYQGDHVVGAGQAAITHHGYVRPQDRFTLLDEGRHPAGLAKARYSGILPPFGVVADFQRHRVDHAFVAEQFEHSYAVSVSLDALGAMQSVDFEARRDAAGTPKSALQRVQKFNEKSRPVYKAATVLVRTPVEARFEKLHRQGIIASGDLKEIESRLLGARPNSRDSSDGALPPLYHS